MAKIESELSGYQSIPRDLVFDTSLSDRARFVYIFMASKPSDWDFFLEPMAEEIGYSKDTLRKYINELVENGWLARGGQSNENGQFGAVEYIIKATKFSDTEKTRYGKNTTQTDIYIKYNNNNNTDNDNIEKEKKLTKERKKRQTFAYTDDFERAFIKAERKGSKKNAYKRWQALSDEDKEKAFVHIPFYYKSNDRQYLKDFEGYLNGRYFDNVVYDKKGNLLYDPDRNESSDYIPLTDCDIHWSDKHQCYLFVGMFFGNIYDGYSDDNRPNGAKVMLNNGRGFITWDALNKKWQRHE